MTECISEPRLTGYGAIWQYFDQPSQEWTTFLGTKDVNAPKRSRAADLDTTEGDGDGWETSAPSPLKKIEEVAIEGNMLIEQYARLWRMFEDDITTRWRMVLQQVPSQPYLEFCAYIKDMEEQYPMRDLAKQMITLKPSGRPERDYLNPM